ncbi:hypothetical protein DFJ58DRAFT_844373 [Suillus subalutaceus]|uniref:uncharacterized protein n=1 Tax=Suillus subalutaceus TaxID=48586 RepID=UPI001B86756B|nr:uncharacterized protein DFJ58DRAFT_844373 [Suillus subalutaceus]KAG1843265.1 hypothetical protein DFJ58DRAFT_844373 [Suillus subalutaceus]
MAVDNENVQAPYNYQQGEDGSHYDFGNQGEDLDPGSGTWNEDSEAKVIDHFPEPPLAFEESYTFLGLFDADENSIYRKTNLYYPFSGRREWKLAAWLLHSGLSMEKINSFLALEMQKSYEVELNHCLAVSCMPLDYISEPFRYVLRMVSKMYIRTPFSHNIPSSKKTAVRVGSLNMGQKLSRIYTEWMMGDHAWEIQVIVLRILSLSVSPISTWLRGSNHHSNTFLLTALLPVSKFVHKNKRMRGVLQDRLIHHCLNVVLELLKLAAQHGVMLSDPISRSHYCFTILASYIADTPEAMMLACVDDLEGFFREAQKFRLNGVDKPFWWDWLLAEPSHFFTPESLHHIHKEFWDHDAQWIILAVGGSEIDFRVSQLHSPLLVIGTSIQVTSRCHRDVQRSIIAVSADAAPPGVIIASPCIDDEDLGVVFKLGLASQNPISL